MKFRVDLFNQRVMLTAEQLESLIGLIEGAETVSEEHVGEGNGTTGWKNSYIQVIGRMDMDAVKPNIVTDAQYDSLVAITKMRQNDKS